MTYKTLDIGDVVYVFKDSNNLYRRIRQGEYAQGKVISYKLSEDLGFNACEYRVYIYNVQDDFGNIYQGIHREDVFGWCLLKTKDELISDINLYMENLNYIKKNKCQVIEDEEELLQNIINELDEKGCTKKKEI